MAGVSDAGFEKENRSLGVRTLPSLQWGHLTQSLSLLPGCVLRPLQLLLNNYVCYSCLSCADTTLW